MIVALIDNGSLEPAAHRNLRAVAATLAERAGTAVHPVSWKHSDRIAPDALDGTPAWTLGNFVRSMHALGQREFAFVPFFISPQGAIGSALRGDIERLQAELGGFDFSFSPGLAERDAIPVIVAARVRETLAAAQFSRPPVVLVDHGGPSAASAALRDRLAHDVLALLGRDIASLAAASMEGAHPPLLADVLRAPDQAGRDVIVAPLFLSPGRHAGADGDIARICAASPAHCHLAPLVGTHPLAAETLAVALREFLSTLPAQTSA
jgi:sirohydrochlorin ferrochelatase